MNKRVVIAVVIVCLRDLGFFMGSCAIVIGGSVTDNWAGFNL
jgi:hypothetical protein